MKLNLFLSFLFFIIVTEQLFAQDQPKKEYFAGECSKTDITIDGKLNEPAWLKANWQNDFSQYEPYEGKAPSQKTEFAILLDENYIYLGFKSYDTSPDSIVHRLSRRDEVDGDCVAVEFDSYFDK